MTDDELADVLAALVADVRARQPKAPAQPPEERPRPVREIQDRRAR
jgi:hypothetical protein